MCRGILQKACKSTKIFIFLRSVTIDKLKIGKKKKNKNEKQIYEEAHDLQYRI